MVNPMNKKFIRIIIGMLVLISIALAACSEVRSDTGVDPTAPNRSTTEAVETETIQTFSDPFAYCASVGRIDEPDGRYTGPKISDEIIRGYLKAAGLDANSSYPEEFKAMTIWRCMDKKVYTCNFGANLPCDSKADTNRIPTQAMADFCKEFPGSDFIPMSVTGHATVYSWHCVRDAPELLDQIIQVDAAGYLSNIWYSIVPVR